MYEFSLKRYSRSIGLELDLVAACERPDVHIRLILNDNDYKTQMLCVADRSLYSVLFDAKSPTVINLYVMCAKTVLTHSVCIYLYSLFRFLHRFNRECVSAYMRVQIYVYYAIHGDMCVLWFSG